MMPAPTRSPTRRAPSAASPLRVKVRRLRVPCSNWQVRCRTHSEPISSTPPSVPILKFLCTFYLSVECAATETTDGCQDIIGRFGPAERLGRGISDFDICGYRGLEFGDGAMRPALDLLVGQEREEALDLIDPG